MGRLEVSVQSGPADGVLEGQPLPRPDEGIHLQGSLPRSLQGVQVSRNGPLPRPPEGVRGQP